MTNFTLNDPSLLRNLCYIDGQWVGAEGGETFPVTNPASGEVLASVPACGATETRRAIEAARLALPAWAAKSAKERGKILRRLDRKSTRLNSSH